MLDILASMKKDAKRLENLWIKAEKSIDLKILTDLMSLKKIVPNSFDDYLYNIEEEIKGREESLSTQEVDVDKLEKLNHSRFSSIQELEKHLGIELGELDGIEVDDKTLSSRSLIKTSSKEWGSGYLIIHFLDIPNKKNGIYITEWYINN